MRSVRLVLTWGDVQLHPLEAAFAAEPDVSIEKIYYVNPVGPDEYAELGLISGDLDKAAALLDAAEVVEEYEISGSDDGIVYLHYAGSTYMDALLAVLFNHAIVLRWPVEFTRWNGQNGIELTFVGTSHAIQQAIDDIPPGIELHLEQSSQFDGDPRSETPLLTPQQRRVLSTAIEMGYYEIPREATQREIAARLEKSEGTVAEQLQRIEARVLKANRS